MDNALFHKHTDGTAHRPALIHAQILKRTHITI